MDSSEESLPVGWLEMRPALGPSLDGASVSAQMLLSTKNLYRFERMPSCAARVRNVSRVRSQFLLGAPCRTRVLTYGRIDAAHSGVRPGQRSPFQASPCSRVMNAS